MQSDSGCVVALRSLSAAVPAPNESDVAACRLTCGVCTAFATHFVNDDWLLMEQVAGGLTERYWDGLQVLRYALPEPLEGTYETRELGASCPETSKLAKYTLGQ